MVVFNCLCNVDFCFQICPFCDSSFRRLQHRAVPNTGEEEVSVVVAADAALQEGLPVPHQYLHRGAVRDSQRTLCSSQVRRGPTLICSGRDRLPLLVHRAGVDRGNLLPGADGAEGSGYVFGKWQQQAAATAAAAAATVVCWNRR